MVSIKISDLTLFLSTAGWVLYWTDPTKGSDFCKAEWQCTGDLPQGHVPKVWRGGRSGDSSSPPYSQAPGPGPCALHQHSGSQGNSQKPPPYLCHGQHHPCTHTHTHTPLSSACKGHPSFRQRFYPLYKRNTTGDWNLPETLWRQMDRQEKPALISFIKYLRQPFSQ